MSSDLRNSFNSRLIEHYGDKKPLVSKFGSTSYGKIAEDLCISSSLFTKLMSGSATEGMYIRGLRNVQNLINTKELRAKLDQLEMDKKDLETQEEKSFSTNFNRTKKWTLLAFISSGIGLLIVGFYFNYNTNFQGEFKTHPLEDYFNRSPFYEMPYQSAYTPNKHIQNFCPATAFEGEWVLEKPYKLPLPALNRPGLYYLAKSSDMRMKASYISLEKGKVLLGFESMDHEIWFDTTETAMSPKYFNEQTKKYTPDFESLKFEANSNFVLVAKIKSFLLNEFTLKKENVSRKAQPCGRYVYELNKEVLKQYNIDMNLVLNGVLTDFVKTKCSPFIENICNPNEVEENKTRLSYDCFFTIKNENLGFGGGYPYTKTFILKKQNYKDHFICTNCVED